MTRERIEAQLEHHVTDCNSGITVLKSLTSASKHHDGIGTLFGGNIWLLTA
jgi:hypothetical protein